MHVLVTGGAGFIGSHLAEALLNRGDSVAVLDNLSSGSVENILRMQDHPRFSFSNEALDNATALDRLASRADAIVHLAAAVGVHLVLERPTETIETNVLGTHALLGAARRRGCHTLIASTSEVYGKSAALPFSEEDNLLLGPPSRIRWSYAASKLLDEFLGMAAHQEFGLPVTILRLFNVVGPRQTGRYGAVVPRFVKQALRGEPLTVFGDGAPDPLFLSCVRCCAGAAGAARSSRGHRRSDIQRWQRPRSCDWRTCATGGRSRRFNLVGPPCSIRSGLRGRIRRYAAARAGHLENRGGNRLDAISLIARNTG